MVLVPGAVAVEVVAERAEQVRTMLSYVVVQGVAIQGRRFCLPN
jgi:hypothetical protein